MGGMVSNSDLDPPDTASEGTLLEYVQLLVRTLTPQEKSVARPRFGLGEKNDGKVHTLDDMVEKLGMEREMIRKVEARALIKLRQYYMRKLVECYISDL